MIENIILTAGNPNQISIPMVRHHSTDGTPQWGYSGSGPADTALSIVSLFLPGQTDLYTIEAFHRSLGLPENGEDYEQWLETLSTKEQEAHDIRYDREYHLWYPLQPVRLWDGQYVSKEAWALHQLFKFQWLAPLAATKSHILNAQNVRQWTEEQKSKVNTA